MIMSKKGLKFSNSIQQQATDQNKNLIKKTLNGISVTLQATAADFIGLSIDSINRYQNLHHNPPSYVLFKVDY